MICWEEVAKLAPIATASIALVALFVAMISIRTQKAVARNRAAIDVFLKTEMDKEMLAAYRAYTAALRNLETFTSIEDFALTSEYQSIRTYLDVNELICIGINHKVFDEHICYGFWRTMLATACRDAAKVIDHARSQPNGEHTYDQLLHVNHRWTGRPRIWQTWRR
ncbi:MAG: DUF4760 domain-containing protein [Methylocystis sp.]